jgi:hypothetical protein
MERGYEREDKADTGATEGVVPLRSGNGRVYEARTVQDLDKVGTEAR